jgi:hypothetical protein
MRVHCLLSRFDDNCDGYHVILKQNHVFSIDQREQLAIGIAFCHFNWLKHEISKQQLFTRELPEEINTKKAK